ncbi:MAG: DUF4350 domain-containing protein [Bacteroidota bacterium]
MLRLSLLALVLVAASGLPAAQPAVPLAIDYAVEGTVAYDPAVPTPEAVLGFTIGERHTRPEEVIRYVEAVAAASERVVARVHGESYQGRRLMHAVITAPANHARLGAIQAANVRLSEDPASVSDAEIAQMPVVVYQGYAVHGNEATATEAALVYLYHLAAAQGPEVEAQLQNAVVLLDPLMNPDGRDRFVDWVNGARGPALVTDPQNREHREPWPNGRTNHYLFDLNRDWLPTQLVESQHRMAWWHTWRPQVSTDHHEMGPESTFFFQPGIPSRNNPNTPAATFELTGEIATYHAAELDRIGALYYSAESFDDFYYGKGSTYPDVNGGVGILFEQASSRALARETQSNGLLTYAYGVRNQLATSVSTLRGALALREELLRHQRGFYAERPASGAYLIDLSTRRTRGQAMAQALGRSRVRAHSLARDVTADGRTFRAGEALVVPLDQPQGRLVRAAMERTLEYGDSLFYDVSTWTFPLAFGADVAEVPAADGLLGPEAETAFDGGRLVGGRARVAYLVRWDRYFAPRALRRLHQAGVRVRLATSAFAASVGGARTDFPAGTLVVPVRAGGAPPDSVHAVIQRAVAHDHVEAFALTSGLTPAGNDLGSRAWPVLDPPRVAILSGPGTSSNGVGEVWHLLSERFGQPVTLLETDLVGRADLDRYTVLVLANGSYGSLDSAAVARLGAWVRGGGVLIGVQGGARWAAARGMLRASLRPAARDTTARPYDQRDEARGAQAIGGSIFEVALDTSHPLAYGYGASVPVFKSGSAMFAPDTTAAQTDVGVYAAEPVLSGYISSENLARLPGAGALKAGRLGAGRVVLMDFNPSFRAFWWGTDGLLLNAVYLGQAF